MRVNRLTAVKARQITAGGRHADGDGLYLSVKGTSKQWVFLYQRGGKRREMGLGGFPAVSLADARVKAAAARQSLSRGVDPLAERKSAAPQVETFASLSKRVIAAKAPGWRGAKTEAGWSRSLLTYAAALADKHPAEITTDDVLAVIKPLWSTHPESAAKTRERIELVLDAARVEGLRSGENPARWKGHLAVLLPKRQSLTRGHHRAIPYTDAPAFMAALATRKSVSARALEFCVFTVAREGTVRAAVWSQIAGDVWSIPRGGTKSGDAVRVPLSVQARASAAALHHDLVQPGDYVFPGLRWMLSNPALLKVLSAIGYRERTTIHGFRSTFRDWAAERTDHPREIIELAMGHVVAGTAEAAYWRGDAIDKRRALLDDWADYLRPRPPGLEDPPP